MHIVIVEDSLVQRRMLRAYLRHLDHEVTEYDDARTAWEELQRNSALQLVITDWAMPGMDGPSLIRTIRAANLPQYVYVLLLTARNEQKDVISGFDAGADDFITKPINPDELRVRLRVGERILQLERELRTARDAHKHMALHDQLTGLYNRRALYDTLIAQLSVDDAKLLSFLMIDVDHFKAINDRYGHLIGDVALQSIAQVVEESARDTDLAVRWGGEEFAIMLPDTDHQQALQVAERVRRHVGATPLVLPNKERVTMSVSVGVSSTRPPDLVTIDALIDEADAALYTAKHAGRNCVWSALAQTPVRDHEVRAL